MSKVREEGGIVQLISGPQGFIFSGKNERSFSSREKVRKFKTFTISSVYFGSFREKRERNYIRKKNHDKCHGSGEDVYGFSPN